MADKFEKMTIYDVDVKMTTDDGEEVNYSFKPLPFKYYPKAFKVFSAFSNMKEGEDTSKLLEALDEQMIEDLSQLIKVMVSNSYPDLSEEKVENFVISNLFQLIEPLSRVVFKQEKAEPRKVLKVQNELSKSD